MCIYTIEHIEIRDRTMVVLHSPFQIFNCRHSWIFPQHFLIRSVYIIHTNCLSLSELLILYNQFAEIVRENIGFQDGLAPTQCYLGLLTGHCVPLETVSIR